MPRATIPAAVFAGWRVAGCPAREGDNSSMTKGAGLCGIIPVAINSADFHGEGMKLRKERCGMTVFESRQNETTLIAVALGIPAPVFYFQRPPRGPGRAKFDWGRFSP